MPEQSGLCSGMENVKACVPFAITQIATQRLRLRFGKEEQGSGRMASFLSKDKKDAGAKRALLPRGARGGTWAPPTVVTRTSNVPVYPFQHSRSWHIVLCVDYYNGAHRICQQNFLQNGKNGRFFGLRIGNLSDIMFFVVNCRDTEVFPCRDFFFRTAVLWTVPLS